MKVYLLHMALVGFLFLMSCQDAKTAQFNILEFGAIPDGKTLNTQAIQSAINVAIRTKGTIVIPKGTFLTGSLQLGPHMTLQIDDDATLLASPNMADYSERVFISAPFADSLMIRGKGTINGNGTAFFDEKWEFTNRPEPWIVISDAKGVEVKGIQFENSPSHTLNFNFCDGILVDSISIKNDPRSRNTDGIDLRNTRNVKITNADIRTGDDAICLKNTRKKEQWYDPKGNPRSRITENIHVKDCYIESDDSALKLGTGSGYLTQNVTFENIKIRKTRYAMAFFMMDGGTYQNIHFNTIDAETGARHDQEYGIFMDIHQRNEDSPVGQISNIHFENCKIRTKGIFYLSGHPEQNIKDIEIKNVDITFTENLNTAEWHKPKGNKKIKQWKTTSDFTRKRGKIIVAHAEGIQLKNVTIKKAFNNYPIFWERNAEMDTVNLLIQ